MRNIILATMLAAVLVSAGVMGTFATWSDSETSADNYIETGSLDLLVNGADDLPWGTGVPQKVDIVCMIPAKVYGPFEVELWNAGQDCMPNATAYLEIKNPRCANAPPKAGSGYIDPVTGAMKPEPELVAERGGKVNCVTVPGVGTLGDGCTMKSHIRMWVTDDPTIVPDDAIPYPDPRFLMDSKVLNLVGEETRIFDLQPCHAKTIYLYFLLQQPNEESFGLNFFPNPGEPGYDALEWAKFNDWPSWGLMKDTLTFDMEFDLVLWDP